MERTGGGFPPRAASTPMDPRATRKAAASSSACACACASYRPKLFSKRDVVFGSSQSDLSPLVQSRSSRGGRRRRRMRSAVLLRHWSLAVFLLCSPVAPYGRTADALGGRMRRSVSHAQLMHDKGRSMQELKRRLWLQELLEEVHTAEERPPPAHGGGGGGGASPDFSGNDLRQKPPEATKDLPHRSGPEREGPVLPQETHKASAYKDQPLKVATKRKKKARLGRRRDGDKKRRRTRSVPTPD